MQTLASAFDWIFAQLGQPADLLRALARAVLEGVVVALILGAALSIRRMRSRRDARRQIGDQLLRVLGLRLEVEGGPLGTRQIRLAELSPESIRGRDALQRLQWQIDLYRDYLSFREITLLQSAIESLDRVSVHAGSASHYYAKDVIPKLARTFLPRRVGPLLAAHTEARHWSELLATRADFERLSGHAPQEQGG